MTDGIYRLRAVTALHAGTGHGVGDIDLPIAREASTKLPIVPGSTVKGVVRDGMDPAGNGTHKSSDVNEWAALFGPSYAEDEPNPAGGQQKVNHAGMLMFEDARLLAMPVRSLKGTCAWVTCPFVLTRYAESLRAAQQPVLDPKFNALTIAAGKIAASGVLLHKSKAMLDELDLDHDPGNDEAREAWASHLAQYFLPSPIAGGPHGAQDCFRKLFIERVAIVDDEIFAFLAETATDVRARIRLNEDRTVAKGALWYEELLPADSLLWGEWGAQQVRAITLAPAAACAKVQSQTLQMGGKATVGHGRVDFLV